MKIKVLFLIPTLENGGAEKVLINLVNNLDFDRFDVTVQTIFDVGVHKNNLKENIHYRTVLSAPIHGYSHIIKVISPSVLYKLIVGERYDIIISYLEGVTAKIISGCCYPKTKRIGWIHTTMDSKRVLCKGFISTKQALKTYNSFDCLIFVSQDSLNAFKKWGAISCSTKVLYNTVESEMIKHLSCEKLDDINIEKQFINICSVGKIISLKGFDRLAHICLRLKKENKNVRFYIIGDGENLPEIKKYITDNGLENCFFFLGYKENPYKYVAACDIYVCASRREGFSTAVTEALIVGTAVVSTMCAGVKELLGINNEFGIVTQNSEQDLYKGLLKLINDPNLLRYYTSQARIRGQFFNKSETINEVQKTFEEVLDG